MTTTKEERFVVIAALGSVAVIVGANAYKRQFPPGRQMIAAGLVFVGVAALADADPRMAGPASGLAFASITIAQGLDFAHGLGNVKSYGGAVKKTTAAAGAGSSPGATGAFAPSSPLTPTVAGGTLQRNIVASAMTWLGVPYRWGGNDRSGVDCSGLTQQVYGSVGIKIPRVSSAQYHFGGPIYKDTNPPAGAEVFFNWPTEVPPGHCGISLGGGSFIHAPHTGDVVKVSNLAQYIASGAKWYGYTLPFQKGK
jgi:cell wall-associated NlpC family hydrolase